MITLGGDDKDIIRMSIELDEYSGKVYLQIEYNYNRIQLIKLN